MDVLNPLLASFASAFTQTHRLFTLRFATAELDDVLLPHTLTGTEALSQCYRLQLTCLSNDAAIALKSLLGQAVDIAIVLADGGERVLSGLITQATQLGGDGGFARYGLVVEPALAALALRRNSRVFQDKSVVEIVRLILDEHIAVNPAFALSFRQRELLTQTYPLRSYCQQYRESDGHFIERLLREEGISYYFDFGHGADEVGLHTLVLFDSGSELDPALQSAIRFHRADATEDEDSITQWHASRQIQSGSVALASFDYKGVYTQQGSDASAIDHGEGGSGLASTLEQYDPQGLYYGADNSELLRYAQLRQQDHDLRAKTFSGAGVVRGLGVGQVFTLDAHPAHAGESALDRQFVVLSQTFAARNNLPGELEKNLPTPRKANAASDTAGLTEPGYQNHFQAVRKSIPIVPAYAHTGHAKPTARGLQTAQVVGPAGETIYTDALGRIKIQFHWARAQDHDPATHGASAASNDFSSCWVRVAYPSAGAGFGHQFLPRIGQEVLVEFIEGDIDRPVVLGSLYNGQHTPPMFQHAGSLPANKTLSGIRTREVQGHRHNELVFDDTTDEIRTTLASEHGHTQLNQGYLIHPRTDGKGEPRGEGFELRSDNAGAIRAAQGLLITTEAQAHAGGKQLDRNAARAQLDAAQSLTQQLGATAQQHNASSADPAPALNSDPLEDKQPHLLVHGHAGLSLTTPHTTVIAAGEDVHQIAQRDTHQTTGRRWIHNVGESVSLFVAGMQNALQASLKLIAAKGNIQLQAQSADIEITADQSLRITACKGTLNVSAKEEILIACGGGYIRLYGGNIEIHCPGSIHLKAADHLMEGPGSMAVTMPVLPDLNFTKPPETPVYSTALAFPTNPDYWQPFAVGKSSTVRNDSSQLTLLQRDSNQVHASGCYTTAAAEITHWLSANESWSHSFDIEREGVEQESGHE